MPNRPDDPRATQPAQAKRRYARQRLRAPIELTPQGLRHTPAVDGGPRSVDVSALAESLSSHQYLPA